MKIIVMALIALIGSVLIAGPFFAVALWRYHRASIKTASGWLHSESMTRAELRAAEIRRLETALGIGDGS